MDSEQAYHCYHALSAVQVASLHASILSDQIQEWRNLRCCVLEMQCWLNRILPDDKIPYVGNLPENPIAHEYISHLCSLPDAQKVTNIRQKTELRHLRFLITDIVNLSKQQARLYQQTVVICFGLWTAISKSERQSKLYEEITDQLSHRLDTGYYTVNVKMPTQELSAQWWNIRIAVAKGQVINGYHMAIENLIKRTIFNPDQVKFLNKCVSQSIVDLYEARGRQDCFLTIPFSNYIPSNDIDKFQKRIKQIPAKDKFDYFCDNRPWFLELEQERSLI